MQPWELWQQLTPPHRVAPGGHTQLLFLQMPSEQRSPQPPQFWTSLRVSTQKSLGGHAVYGLVHTQFPPTHFSSPRQYVKQLPQLPTSLVRSTQPYAQAVKLSGHSHIPHSHVSLQVCECALKPRSAQLCLLPGAQPSPVHGPQPDMPAAGSQLRVWVPQFPQRCVSATPLQSAAHSPHAQPSLHVCVRPDPVAPQARTMPGVHTPPGLQADHSDSPPSVHVRVCSPHMQGRDNGASAGHSHLAGH